MFLINNIPDNKIDIYILPIHLYFSNYIQSLLQRACIDTAKCIIGNERYINDIVDFSFLKVFCDYQGIV